MYAGHIVQVEFFHFEPRASFEEVMRDTRFRARIGANTKTTLRFVDRNAMVFGVATLYQEESEKNQALLNRLGDSVSVRNPLARRISRSFSRLGAYKRSTHASAKELLLKDLQKKKPVACELPDRRFRLIHEDERHEMIEAVQASKAWWVFVFPRSQLLETSHPHAVVQVM